MLLGQSCWTDFTFIREGLLSQTGSGGRAASQAVQVWIHCDLYVLKNEIVAVAHSITNLELKDEAENEF